MNSKRDGNSGPPGRGRGRGQGPAHLRQLSQLTPEARADARIRGLIPLGEYSGGRAPGERNVRARPDPHQAQAAQNNDGTFVVNVSCDNMEGRSVSLRAPNDLDLSICAKAVEMIFGKVTPSAISFSAALRADSQIWLDDDHQRQLGFDGAIEIFKQQKVTGEKKNFLCFFVLC